MIKTQRRERCERSAKVNTVAPEIAHLSIGVISLYLSSHPLLINALILGEGYYYHLLVPARVDLPDWINSLLSTPVAMTRPR